MITAVNRFFWLLKKLRGRKDKDRDERRGNGRKRRKKEGLQIRVATPAEEFFNHEETRGPDPFEFNELPRWWQLVAASTLMGGVFTLILVAVLIGPFLTGFLPAGLNVLRERLPEVMTMRAEEEIDTLSSEEVRWPEQIGHSIWPSREAWLLFGPNAPGETPPLSALSEKAGPMEVELDPLTGDPVLPLPSIRRESARNFEHPHSDAKSEGVSPEEQSHDLEFNPYPWAEEETAAEEQAEESQGQDPEFNPYPWAEGTLQEIQGEDLRIIPHTWAEELLSEQGEGVGADPTGNAYPPVVSGIFVNPDMLRLGAQGEWVILHRRAESQRRIPFLGWRTQEWVYFGETRNTNFAEEGWSGRDEKGEKWFKALVLWAPGDPDYADSQEGTFVHPFRLWFRSDE